MSLGRPDSPIGGAISRRGFLWRAPLGALALAYLPAFRARADDPVPARRPRVGRRVLVPVFLRGGMDGLNVVVPHAEPDYYRLRPSIAIPRPGSGEGAALELDERFGLHPALAPLMPLRHAGRMALLHAVGRPRNTRSHFAEQDAWETAAPGAEVRADGWLNRFLAEHDPSGPIRAVSFASELPRILRGRVPVQAVATLEELSLGTGDDRAARTRAALGAAYGGEGALAGAGREALEAVRVLGALDPHRYQAAAGADYPDHELARTFRQAAQLIKADVGLEVVEIEVAGWDTHQRQGGPEGRMAGHLRHVAGSIAAFLRDLEAHASDVLVLAFSEFGRTAAENGTAGTDHGNGNCVLAFGPGLDASAVHGAWPGLGSGQTDGEGDLAHTTDFRSVFRDVVVRHLGCADAGAILPGWEAPPTGLFTP